MRTRTRSDAREQVLGVAISHPARLVDPASGTTKLDLARYYEAVAGAMLPHVAGRPLTLVHCPGGLAGPCRFMKHSKVRSPPAVPRIEIQEKHKRGEYLYVDAPRALVSLAQLDMIEIHTWNTRVGRLERPDRIVVDLDPGPEVPWSELVSAAHEVRAALRALGLEAWLKTTGGAGLHVVIPIAPRHDWSTCLAFARALAAVLERHAPARYSTAYARRGRERRILVDYLRNNRTNTSVAAFSTRARERLPISVPIAWDELEPGRRPPAWDVRSVPRRLATLGADPWAGYHRHPQRLSRALLQAIGAVPTIARGGAAMRTLLVVLAASAASLQPGAARAGEGAVDGRIVTDQATIEIVEPHHGRVIETPEGFLRIEDGPDLDQTDTVGSFGTYHVEPGATEPVTDRVAQRLPSEGLGAGLRAGGLVADRVALRADGLVDTAAPVAGADPCRAQRGRYLRRVLEMSGVNVDRPVELLDGLAGPGAGGNLIATGGNVLGTGFVAPGVDPIKPLAWDQELRSLGRDLAECQERAAAHP